MSPRPPTTSRDEIVRAAVRLMAADGVEAFSMRRLAASMGVDPMTLYHHVPDKAALLDAVVDDLWGSVLPPAADAGSWQEIFADLARSLRDVLRASPRLAPLVATRATPTPGMLTLAERLLASTAAAGLEGADAMQLLDCVVGYVVGKTRGELAGARGDHRTGAPVGVSPETHPLLLAAMGSGYAWDPDGEFERGLAALLRGWA